VTHFSVQRRAHYGGEWGDGEDKGEGEGVKVMQWQAVESVKQVGSSYRYPGMCVKKEGMDKGYDKMIKTIK
jgi:hypothetical protein